MELLKGYASINNQIEKMNYLSQNVIAIYNFFYLMLYM
jgi:hypothetical protein